MWEERRGEDYRGGTQNKEKILNGGKCFTKEDRIPLKANFLFEMCFTWTLCYAHKDLNKPPQTTISLQMHRELRSYPNWVWNKIIFAISDREMQAQKLPQNK